MKIKSQTLTTAVTRFYDTINPMKLNRLVLVSAILLATIKLPSSFAAIDQSKSFFGESITKEELQKRYDSGDKIKILIVPGHDNKSGAEFKGIREADLNLEIGEKLYLLFKMDPHFEPSITRDKNGYNKLLSAYFSLKRSAIIEFRNQHKKILESAVKKGLIEKIFSLLGTFASKEGAIKLYGINKWANENNIDIVINLHFNDDPLRRHNRKGKFSGFSIVVPEKQLPNAKASRIIAESVFSKLEKYLPSSNMPLEKDGIIENQELIALGARASLDAASILIEYAYIYEPQFSNRVIAPLLNGELAFQTYEGIKNFFDPNVKIFKYGSSLLPFEWTNQLGINLKNSKDVLALKTALIQESFYPPSDTKNLRCFLDGDFEKCAEKAVFAFQKKYKLGETGFVDFSTLKKLNELYAR